MVAHLGDTNELSKEMAQNAIDNVGPLCPCVFCRQSFPVFLQQVKASGHTSFSKMVYDLHNKVNDKLAMQRWATAQKTLSLTTPYKDVAEYISKVPTFDTFLKRQILYDSEPVNGHDVALLIAVLAQRIEPATKWNFLLFASSVAVALGKIKNKHLNLLSDLLTAECLQLRKFMSGDLMPGNFSNVYTTFTGMSPETLAKKMHLMKAGVCAAGTCV